MILNNRAIRERANQERANQQRDTQKYINQIEYRLSGIYNIIEKISNNPDYITTNNEDGYTLLTFAVINNNKIVVNYLCENYKNELIDKLDSHDLTPLLYAVKRDNIEIVNILCNYGVNLNQEGLINLDNTKSMRSNVTPLMLAIIRGNDEIIHKLLSSHADVNYQITMFDEFRTEYKSLTALCYAVKEKKIDIVRKLLLLGADVSLEIFDKSQSTSIYRGEHPTYTGYLNILYYTKSLYPKLTLDNIIKDDSVTDELILFTMLSIRIIESQYKKNKKGARS